MNATTKKPATTAPADISAWQDDPESKLPAIKRPVPDLAKGKLKFRIREAAVKPGTYPAGTPQFRYWTAAEALRRGGDFWGALIAAKHWHVGAVLPVSLDKGIDLNAYYDRTELAFFHQQVGSITYYSGESPDVVCHEMGHACLDAVRPELFDAPFIEAAAFHESFGDMSAILSALQLQSVRTAALAGVGGHKATPLSRIAEQLGNAIRQVAPDAVDKDCLRNAYNKFKYVDPATLPDRAPASRLCAEAHSFSRVFTGAFYEILSAMLKIRAKKPAEADLAAVATDFALLLLDAIAAAPVQPDYFAQVAAHVIDADTARFAGKYRSALIAVFVGRAIVPKAAVRALAAHRGRVAGVAKPAPPQTATQKVVLDAAEFGLGDRKLVVPAPLERKAFLSAAAGLAHRDTGRETLVAAAHRFVRLLFARDRVDAERGRKKVAVTPETRHDELKKTHVVTKTKDGLQLKRRLFHCGCGIPGADAHAISTRSTVSSRSG